MTTAEELCNRRVVTIGRVPVVNGEGVLQGIIALDDLLEFRPEEGLHAVSRSR